MDVNTVAITIGPHGELITDRIGMEDVDTTLIDGTSLSMLIKERIEGGWNVTVTTRRRDDGKQGELSIPASWARRLGVEDQAIRK